MQAEELARLEEALAASASELTRRTGGGGDSTQSWEDALTRLTSVAVANVPGAAYAGLTMRDRDGTLTSRAPSHEGIAALDRRQAELGEGPCVDTLETGHAVVTEVEDFTVEPRWPRFGPAAVEHGVLSLLSYAFAPHDAPPGAINFYGVERAAFTDRTARTVAGAFAMQAAVATYGARRITELERGLASRDVIGQAKGILIERFTLDDTGAFDLLVRSSQDANIKLVDVARWLVDDTISRRDARTAPDR